MSAAWKPRSEGSGAFGCDAPPSVPVWLMLPFGPGVIPDDGAFMMTGPAQFPACTLAQLSM